MGIDAEMFIKVRRPISSEDVKRLSWEMVERFGGERFWREEGPIAVIPVYEQDGPDIHPESGETFLRIYFWSRFYGPGYERGNALFIINLAEWLEAATGGEIWYGSDSSGICARLFDAEARQQLKQYFFAVGHRPYEDRTLRMASYVREPQEPLDDRPPIMTPETCTRCVTNPNLRPYRMGWGDKFAAFHCQGCDRTAETHDDGATWTFSKEKE